MAGPRLLDKKTVHAEVATQKKHQIDAGIFLAKKVDAVREMLANEQSNLESFRKESIARTQVEIDAKILERQSLDDSLVPLRKEYERLLVPPDLTFERELVQRGKLANELKGRELQEKEVELKSGMSRNLQRERENEEESQRVSVERQRSSEELIKADALKGDAVKALFNAHAEAKKIITAAEARERAVANRESEVSERENTFVAIQETVRLHETDLAMREKKLKVNQNILIKSRDYLKHKK